jgi:pimeloyl-ACP methyl ester carboxylesterase
MGQDSYPKGMKQFLAFLLFLLFTSLWFLSADLPAEAQTTTPDLASGTFGGALEPLSVGFGSLGIENNSTTTLSVNQASVLSWSVSSAGNDGTNLLAYLNTLKNAVFTVQVYHGVMGSSTLLYSQTMPAGAITYFSTFPYTFPFTGHYFVTYTATYPAGEYPIGYTSICPANDCVQPAYSLTSFESFMTEGQSEDPSAYQNFVPAYLGINEFTVQEAGAKDSNVLFLPGTLESRLYARDYNGNEKLVWEPTSNQNIPLLAMNSDGSVKNILYTRDIIDYLYSGNPTLSSIVQGISKSSATLYGPFEKFMNGLVSNGTIRTWQAYPYDWRFDVTDIVKDGTLTSSSPTSEVNRIYLQDVIQNLASSSPTGQVTLIAHSNGGLLAKAMAVQLQKEGKLNLIDKIILVGTPQLGTPSAIGNILHGDGQTRVLGLITYGDTVRTAALTMPGPYDLLPSRRYFSFATAPVISFANSLNATYGKMYTNTITSYDALEKFLTDSQNLHGIPEIGDTNTPAIVSSTLLQKAQATHDAIDDWVPPDSLAVDTIVGAFQPTPQGYTYANNPNAIVCNFSISPLSTCKNIPSVSHTPVFTSLGDDTVLAISAIDQASSTYYFAANTFKADTGQNIVHESLLSASPIQDQIKYLLDGSTTTSPYIIPFLSATNSSGVISENSTVIVSEAPLNLVAMDTNKNETGVLPIADLQGMYLAKEDIPNSLVQTVGDKNYLDLPANSTYSVTGTAYDTGSGAIEIGTEDQTGAISIQNTFANVSVSTSTVVSFNVSTSSVSALDIDEDGDGVIDSIATSTSQIETDSSVPSSTEESSSTDSNTTPIENSSSTTENVTGGYTQQSGTGSFGSSGTAPSLNFISALLPHSSLLSATATDSIFTLYLQLEVKLLILEIQFVKVFHHLPKF